MAIEKYTLTDNMNKVMTNDDIPATTAIDVGLSNAYIENTECADNLTEVMTALEKQAESVTLEEPEAPSVPSDNIYTKKLTLDESVEDFKSLFDDDSSDEDEYLDYDMFNFVYGIVTDSWPKPKNPLNHPIRKFRYTGEDDYVKTDSNRGVPQVSTDINDNIVVYADDAEAFNDAKAVCKYYNIECGPVKPRLSKDSKWAFNMTIMVPKTADGYPMMAEDFFAQFGLSLSDVIEDHKVGQGKSANWGNTYATKAAKDRAALTDLQNEEAVKRIYKKYHDKAAWSNDPIEIFIKEMFAELDSHNLKYSKGALKKQFTNDFTDDFEDDSMEEGFLSNAVGGVGTAISNIATSIF